MRRVGVLALAALALTTTCGFALAGSGCSQACTPVNDHDNAAIIEQAIRLILERPGFQEKTFQALQDANDPKPITDDSAFMMIWRDDSDVEPYAGVEDFLAKNPGCCEIVENNPEGYAPSPLERRSGKLEGFVRLRFTAWLKAPNPMLKPRAVQREVYLPYSGCGIVRRDI